MASFTIQLSKLLKESDKELREKIKLLLSSKEQNGDEEQDHQEVEDHEEVERQKFDFLDQNLSETNPRLNLTWVMNLSQDDLVSMILRDREFSSKRYLLVHQLCCLNKPTELIIYLLEHGFKASKGDILEIIKNKNFNLLQYYHRKRVLRGALWDSGCFKEAILRNQLDILKYLIQHNLVDLSVMSCHKNRSFAVLQAVRACFEERDTSSLWLLLQNFPEHTKNCVDWVLLQDFKGKYLSSWFYVWVENQITHPEVT